MIHRNREKTYVRLCFYRGFEIKIITRTKEFAVFDKSGPVVYITSKREDALNWIDKTNSQTKWDHYTVAGEIKHSKEKEKLDCIKKEEWKNKYPKKRQAGETYPW